MVAQARRKLCCAAAIAALAAPRLVFAAPPAIELLSLRPEYGAGNRLLAAPEASPPAALLPRVRIVRSLRFAGLDRQVRLDGILSIDGDYPILDGRLLVHWGRARIALPLPSLQALPRMFFGTLTFEVRVRLIAARF